MRILTICAEYAPLAKVGGLGDVTAGLSSWLSGRGHQVVVVMPYYGAMREAGVRLEAGATLGPQTVRAGGANAVFSVHRMAGLHGDGPAIYLVDSPALFPGAVYAAGEQEAVRFMLLSRAALEFASASGFKPDIVHCHDWHASPAAVLLKGSRYRLPVFQQAYTVLTIHNIGYQGVFDAGVLERSGAAEMRALFAADEAGRSAVNFLRAGISHADALTTVSPTHAREIQTPAFGHGLDPLLRQRRHRLAGILNGVDYSHWSPESDPLLPAPYSASDLTGKLATRRALIGDLQLDASPETPVVGLVSRLAQHKGIDLVIHALPDLLRERSFACAFLGNGEERYVEGLQDLARDFPGRVAHIDAYDEALAHRILAGSDLLLVPSLYEPCGLTQMYAMRYGTVPVVRETGGLADTVTHFDPATGVGTGSVFRDADVGGLNWGLNTALDWFANRPAWNRLLRNGMAQDFSWDRQGPKYEALFARLA